jgi:hypothetical protein
MQQHKTIAGSNPNSNPPLQELDEEILEALSPLGTPVRLTCPKGHYMGYLVIKKTTDDAMFLLCRHKSCREHAAFYINQALLTNGQTLSDNESGRTAVVRGQEANPEPPGKGE